MELQALSGPAALSKMLLKTKSNCKKLANQLHTKVIFLQSIVYFWCYKTVFYTAGLRSITSKIAYKTLDLLLDSASLEPYSVRALDKESQLCSLCYFSNITA